jgi:hypothetical protein
MRVKNNPNYVRAPRRPRSARRNATFYKSILLDKYIGLTLIAQSGEPRRKERAIAALAEMDSKYPGIKEQAEAKQQGTFLPHIYVPESTPATTHKSGVKTKKEQVTTVEPTLKTPSKEPLELLNKVARTEFKRLKNIMGKKHSPQEATDIISNSVIAWLNKHLSTPEEFNNLSKWATVGLTSSDPDYNMRIDIKATVGKIEHKFRVEELQKKRAASLTREGEDGQIRQEDIEGTFIAPDSENDEDINSDADSYTKSELISDQLRMIIIGLHLGWPGTIADQPSKWVNTKIPIKRRVYRKDVPMELQSSDESVTHRVVLARSAIDAYTYHSLGHFLRDCPSCRALARFLRYPFVTPEYITALMEQNASEKIIRT